MNECFTRYKAKYPTFATVAFEDKKLALPLQAADMVAYRSRRIASQWADGVKDGEGFEDNREFTKTLFNSAFAYFDQHKEAVFRAYSSGSLDYDYFRKHG